MENRSVQLKLYYRKKLLVSLKTFKQLIQLISVFLRARPFTKTNLNKYRRNERKWLKEQRSQIL